MLARSDLLTRLIWKSCTERNSGSAITGDPNCPSSPSDPAVAWRSRGNLTWPCQPTESDTQPVYGIERLYRKPADSGRGEPTELHGYLRGRSAIKEEQRLLRAPGPGRRHLNRASAGQGQPHRSRLLGPRGQDPDL